MQFFLFWSGHVTPCTPCWSLESLPSCLSQADDVHFYQGCHSLTYLINMLELTRFIVNHYVWFLQNSSQNPLGHTQKKKKKKRRRCTTAAITSSFFITRVSPKSCTLTRACSRTFVCAWNRLFCSPAAAWALVNKRKWKSIFPNYTDLWSTYKSMWSLLIKVQSLTCASLSDQFAGTSCNCVHHAHEKSPVNF